MCQTPLLIPNAKRLPIDISNTDVANRVPSLSANKLAIIQCAEEKIQSDSSVSIGLGCGQNSQIVFFC